MRFRSAGESFQLQGVKGGPEACWDGPGTGTDLSIGTGIGIGDGAELLSHYCGIAGYRMEGCYVLPGLDTGEMWPSWSRSNSTIMICHARQCNLVGKGFGAARDDPFGNGTFRCNLAFLVSWSAYFMVHTLG